MTDLCVDTVKMSGAPPPPPPGVCSFTYLFLSRRPNDSKSSNSVPEQDPFYRLMFAGGEGERGGGPKPV